MESVTVSVIVSFLIGCVVTSLIWWLVGFIKDKFRVGRLVLGAARFVKDSVVTYKSDKKKIDEFIGLLGDSGTLIIKPHISDANDDAIAWHYVSFTVVDKKKHIEFVLMDGTKKYLPFYVITSHPVNCEIEKE